MIRVAIGFALAAASLALSVLWLRLDYWVVFYDASGSYANRGHSGLYQACMADICMPFIPLWSPFVDYLKALCVTGISLFGVFLFVATTALCCMQWQWQYLWRYTAIGITIQGLFLCTAGALSLMQLNDMKGTIVALWKYPDAKVHAGYCTWSAFALGLAGMLEGMGMFYYSHTARDLQKEQHQIQDANAMIDQFNIQYAAANEQHTSAGVQGVEQPASVVLQNQTGVVMQPSDLAGNPSGQVGNVAVPPPYTIYNVIPPYSSNN